MPTPSNYVIPVSNGLLAHRERIGNAIWVFLWLIDHVTKEADSTSDSECEGLVYGGAPVAARKIADDLRESPRTIQAHIDRLCSEGYVKRIPHGPGEAFGYLIRKSKKWSKTRTVILPDTLAEKQHTPAETPQGCEEKPQTPAVNLRANKEDNTKQNKTGEGSSDLIPADWESFDAEPHVETIRQLWPGRYDGSQVTQTAILDRFAEEAKRERGTMEAAAEYITGRIRSMAPILRKNPAQIQYKSLRSIFAARAYRTPDSEWRAEILGNTPQSNRAVARSASEEMRAQREASR